MKWSAVHRKLARADKAIEKAMEKAEMPGAVLLARMPKHGEVIEHASRHGFAVVRPERLAMTRETIFDLASLTKPMATTTSVMLLVNDGAVGLDDPVSKYLPSFAERDKDAVTVRHLLTHSAGLKPLRKFHEELIERERKKGERWIGTPQAKDFVVERVIKSGLVHDPGKAAVYGDLDFIALGALVEAVARQPLDEFCQERIFGPLDMRDTFFVRLGEGEAAVPPALRQRIAATENCPWRDRVLWGEVHDPNASVMGGVAGHAGLFSTADDVMKFALALVDVWHGRSELWPQKLLREFATRQGMPKGSDWALGWDTPTEGASSAGKHFSPNSVGHLGFTGTSLWIDLEAEAVVIFLTNRCHQVAKYSRFELRSVVHDLVREGFAEG